MRFSWWFVKYLFLLCLIALLYGFGTERNQQRKLKGLQVEFLDENEPFITLDAVNKLLIQNKDSITSIVKETLVLNEMELRLLANPMIENAEVFVTVDGVLGALIEQRDPIARVSGSPDYYLDSRGEKMPLSSVYTARVPLVTGNTSQLSELTELLLAIENDPFLKNSIIGLHLERPADIYLRMRSLNMNIRFGEPKEIARKVRNLKAFYKKAKQDNLMSNYNLIDLRYGNQVVATKKQSHGT